MERRARIGVQSERWFGQDRGRGGGEGQAAYGNVEQGHREESGGKPRHEANDREEGPGEAVARFSRVRAAPRAPDRGPLPGPVSSPARPGAHSTGLWKTSPGMGSGT